MPSCMITPVLSRAAAGKAIARDQNTALAHNQSSKLGVPDTPSTSARRRAAGSRRVQAFLRPSRRSLHKVVARDALELQVT